MHKNFKKYSFYKYLSWFYSFMHKFQIFSICLPFVRGKLFFHKRFKALLPLSCNVSRAVFGKLPCNYAADNHFVRVWRFAPPAVLENLNGAKNYSLSGEKAGIPALHKNLRANSSNVVPALILSLSFVVRSALNASPARCALPHRQSQI